MTVPGAVPASMAKRLLAAVVDGVAAILLGGAFVVAALPGVLAPEEGAGTPALLLVGVALGTLLAVVQWWLLGRRGWTIGKRLVGLRVLSATTGQPVGLGRALVRLLVPAAGVLALGVGPVLVHLSPFFDRSGLRQGWHDRAAGTVVLDVVVGRDPTTAAEPVGASDAYRRMEDLLRASVPQAVPAARAPGQVPSRGADEAPAADETAVLPAPIAAVPGVPARPTERPVERSRPRVLIRRPEPVDHAREPVDHAREPVLTGTHAAAPRYEVLTASRPGAGQPATPSTDPVVDRHRADGPVRDHTDPRPVVDVPSPPSSDAPGPAPSARPEPSPVDGPGGGSGDVVDAVPAFVARRQTTSLDEDVERTRLRPARGKVPEMDAPGPPAVTLQITDGRRIVLAGTALVGRNPAAREGEQADQLIEVADPGRSVSKTHLAVGVDATGVWVKDRDSTNGTVITLADGQQILCGVGQQVRVPPGASVSFGDYGFTVAAAG